MENLIERLRSGEPCCEASGNNDCRTKDAASGCLCAMAADEIERLKTELSDLQKTFDLRWKADMRGIKKWQEAHPGNDLTWPDRADMVEWLLNENKILNDALTMATNDVNKLYDKLENKS